MGTPVIWPRNLLDPQAWNPGWDPLRATGGRLALSTRKFNIGAPTLGMWRPVLGNIQVWTDQERSTLQAIETLVNGDDSPILVPYLHGEYGPFYSQQEYEEFDDGSEYSDTELIESPRTICLVAVDGSAGDTIVKMERLFCKEMYTSYTFSINNHLYRVRKVIRESATTSKVEIIPELRGDIADGDWIEFDNPVVKCWLTDPTALSAVWQAPFRSAIDLRFVEDTTP